MAKEQLPLPSLPVSKTGDPIFLSSLLIRNPSGIDISSTAPFHSGYLISCLVSQWREGNSLIRYGEIVIVMH